MYSTFRGLRISVLLLLLLSIVALPSLTLGQEQKTKQEHRDRLIAAAREIMAAARYCALITLDSVGRPQARTMDPFPPGEDMVIWFGTNPRSRKVAEIRKNQRVTLYYFDAQGQGYVTISGTARLVDDPNEKARRWKDEWKSFYPDREKGYLLIAVTPENLEAVSESKGITGHPNTWEAPSVTFKTGKANN